MTDNKDNTELAFTTVIETTIDGSGISIGSQHDQSGAYSNGYVPYGNIRKLIKQLEIHLEKLNHE